MEGREMLPVSEFPVPCVQTVGDVLRFVRNASDSAANPIWDALWQGHSPGRIAVCIRPAAARVAQVKERYRLDLDATVPDPGRWCEPWRQALDDQLYAMAAQMQLPGDYRPAISVPRFVHGQSQGITDLFGARVEAQPDGKYFTHPLPPDPAALASLRPRALETSLYWGAVEWTRYAHSATRGALPFRNPVMTGPIDTACYLLGPTALLEWLYTEPDAVHRLLDTIADVVIAMMGALIEAAGGCMCPSEGAAMRGGFDLCSEVRSLISAAVFEEFEAPALRRIGEALGPYGVHSCGSWERTIPGSLRDPNLRLLHGQIKENDLATLCRLAGGRVALAIGRSVNVHQRFLWPDTAGFFRHILESVPPAQPFQVVIGENDIPLWNALHREIRGTDYPWTPPMWS